MKNYWYFTFLLTVFTGCSSSDDVSQDQIEINKLLYTSSNKHQVSDYDNTTEYIIEDNKVVSARYFLNNNPEEVHLSTFHYNQNGKIEKVFNNGELNRKVVWLDNMAKVYTADDELVSEFEFNTDRQIIRYKTFGPNESIFIRKYNYSPNGNVVSMEDEEGVVAEFLDYEIDLRNPFYLLNSIAVLNIHKRPHFKNMFRTEKFYPFEGDDFSVPLQFYDYHWTLNGDGMVETIEDEKSVIYTREFQYN